MSRPVKVPDELYESLRLEAEGNGISVMDALQRRLRVGEAELASLRLSRDDLGRTLERTRAELARVARGGTAREAMANRLAGEAGHLRRAAAAQAQRIAELAEELTVVREEAATLQLNRDEARRAAQARSGQLKAVLVCLAIGLSAWIVWQCWKRAKAPAAAAPVPEPPELTWTKRL